MLQKSENKTGQSLSKHQKIMEYNKSEWWASIYNRICKMCGISILKYEKGCFFPAIFDLLNRKKANILDDTI